MFNKCFMKFEYIFKFYDNINEKYKYFKFILIFSIVFSILCKRFVMKENIMMDPSLLSLIFWVAVC